MQISSTRIARESAPWAAGREYPLNTILEHEGHHYIVSDDHYSTRELEPGSPGAGQRYKALEPIYSGAREEPIPITNMVIEHDKYYSFGGGLYLAVQSMPQASINPAQLPAIFQPVPWGNMAGTEQDAIPFIYGMAVENGKIYSHEGGLWRWVYTDTPGCIWVPGTAGVWFWERVE